RWVFLHMGKNTELREMYNVTTLPQFYLVDPDGILLQAPAARPSPSGTGRTIDETFWKIQKKLHPVEHHIPGQKN
ncbi:MAG TPA: hypothetical protein VD905_08385, partial [Flavobacteriales bacterium]|nr:hypothetical protein [Flavobacteriales bacterium]